jgi:Terminase large subunit, T4likevirus-type, N-terminal
VGGGGEGAQAAQPQGQIRLYTPHAGQLALHQSAARFRIATCGRRFGKTTAAANEVVACALKRKDSINWWVAPVFHQTERGYRTVLDVLRKARLKWKEQKSLGRVVLSNGSFIEFHSAVNFDNLRGEGLDLLVIDEAAQVAEEAWTKALRPSLADKKGRALFIGTPRGKNWFYKLWLKGQDSARFRGYASWRFPSSANPFIDPAELEMAKEDLPANVYLQEHLAEFLDEAAGVFRNIMACANGQFEEPQAGRAYVIGWDVAKTEDFSVIFVMEKRTKRVVAWDRFNQINYALQLNRLEFFARKYHARVLMDSTGLGDPLLEAAKERRILIDGMVLSNKSKQQLIEGLAVAIERQAISFPPIERLVKELQFYQYEINPKSRTISYSAPEGENDDCVIALALSLWACKGQRMFVTEGEQVRVAKELAARDTREVITFTPSRLDAQQRGWRIDPVTKLPVYPDPRITGTDYQVTPLPSASAEKQTKPKAGDLVPSAAR